MPRTGERDVAALRPCSSPPGVAGCRPPLGEGAGHYREAVWQIGRDEQLDCAGRRGGGPAGGEHEGVVEKMVGCPNGEEGMGKPCQVREGGGDRRRAALLSAEAGEIPVRRAGHPVWVEQIGGLGWPTAGLARGTAPVVDPIRQIDAGDQRCDVVIVAGVGSVLPWRT